MPSGRMPLDLLLEQCDPKLVAFELDLAWISAAGQDPLAYFAKYPGRFPMVHVKGLKKTFTTGLLIRKRVEAVKGVSFDVRRGEIFGFLGPNGAGKTTTIKVLMGLIAPTAGEATLFGRPVPEPASREKVGFLPENPYVYPYLTPREFVTMCGRAPLV